MTITIQITVTDAALVEECGGREGLNERFEEMKQEISQEPLPEGVTMTVVVTEDDGAVKPIFP